MPSPSVLVSAETFSEELFSVELSEVLAAVELALGAPLPRRRERLLLAPL